MKILITGGCGFIGSNLCCLIKSKYPSYHVYAMDNLKRRGSELNIPRLKNLGINFTHGDIRNPEDFDFDTTFDYIIDAAAEPSVMAGIGASLNYLINTNLIGTINTLEHAAKTGAKMVFLSTSRVYPIAYLDQLKFKESDTRFVIADQQNIPGISPMGVTELFPLDKARSLYGTTKLASELIIEEFRAFLNVDAVINRCGVVAGPYQMGKVDQGVIALWIARHYWKGTLSYIGYGGTGKQVRDVMHIYDLFDLVDHELHHFETVCGQTFNAGGGIGSSISLQELTMICREVTGNTITINAIKENRMGDIPLYVTDNTKITNAIGWVPKRTVKDIVTDTYQWMVANEQQLKPILSI